MPAPRGVRVLFPLPLNEALSYRVPEEWPDDAPPIGARVEATLGARLLIGVVVAKEAAEGAKLKPLTAYLDETPQLSEKLLALMAWLSDYYMAPLGEALRLITPPGFLAREREELSLGPKARRLLAGLPDAAASALDPRERARLLRLFAHLPENGWLSANAFMQAAGRRVAKELPDLVTQEWLLARKREAQAPKAQQLVRYHATLPPEEAQKLLKRAPVQAALYAQICERDGATREELVSEAPEAAALLALVKRGFVAKSYEEQARASLAAHHVEIAPTRAFALRPEQEAAIAALAAVIEARDTPPPHLLVGPPGSGKTEVYLGAAEATLARGQSVLMLVPEIALTPQLAARVGARFGKLVALWHSDLSPGERFDEWRRAARGEAKIVVGTRSAIFAPLPKLGLIVVDEEQDASFKSDDGVPYHARDLAVVRARAEGALVLLGSATPSVESEANARRGRYVRLVLPRPAELMPPRLLIADLGAGRAAQASRLSAELLLAIGERLRRREQTILFLNRRGFAPVLQCTACRAPIGCTQCAVTLSYHRHIGRLLCHTCGLSMLPPEVCPVCGSQELQLMGVGTQRVEDELLQHYPEARVARLDRDSTAKKGSLAALVSRMRAGEIDILVGTSLVTKGHDFPGVTLVGVLDADRALNLPDFRAAERAWQLLVQVAGRAGRADKPGEVIIQTRVPEHPVLAALDDAPGFYSGELAARRDLYPPYRRLALIRIECPDFDEALNRATRLAQGLQELLARHPEPSLSILGPVAPLVGFVRGRYRQQLLLRAPLAKPLRTLLLAARQAGLLDDTKLCQIRLDIDPQKLS